MNILMIEPNETPYDERISGSYMEVYRIVGGCPKVLYPFADKSVALVCNEDGKASDLPANRVVRDENGDVETIVGTFFLCGVTDECLDSLPPVKMLRYKAKFQKPGAFPQD